MPNCQLSSLAHVGNKCLLGCLRMKRGKPIHIGQRTTLWYYFKTCSPLNHPHQFLSSYLWSSIMDNRRREILCSLMIFMVLKYFIVSTYFIALRAQNNSHYKWGHPHLGYYQTEIVSNQPLRKKIAQKKIAKELLHESWLILSWLDLCHNR